MISNCGMDERGRIRGGAAGDQTGREWELRKWYSYPWDVVLRYPDKEVRHWMGDQARSAAINNNIGYDQGNRQAFWIQLQKNGYDAEKITVKCEADCSAGVLAIAKAAGYHFDIQALKNINEKGYTGNEEKILVAAGFIALKDARYKTSDKYLDNGDILLNTRSHTAFNVDAGEYYGDDSMIKGIDVSYAQGVIDWERVKPHIDFAIIRCGYGENIRSQDDSQWQRNASECERLGIPYGVYLYSYATTEAGAVSEAEHTLRLIKGRKPTLPVFFDSEQRGTERVAKRLAGIYIKRIRSAGYLCGIYASANWYNTWLKGVDADSYWIAQYGSNNGAAQKKPVIDREINMWQYTSMGAVPGIANRVDMNISYDEINMPKNDLGLKYRAHCQTYGWMPSVHDGMTAGTVGEAKRLEAIKITPPEGVELTVEAHCQKHGWKTYKGIKKGVSSGTGSSPHDPIIGTVGESRRLEAIRIKCTKNTTGKKLKYQVHCQSYGWMRVASEGEMAGTTGQGKRMEAIRIWFE